MKNKIILILSNLLITGVFFIPSMVSLSAQGGGVGILVNPLKDDTITELMGTILNAVVQIGLVVVTFFIIYAGYKYVTARGNPGALKEAHQAILWTLIGSAVVIGAYAIRQIVYDTVTNLAR